MVFDLMSVDFVGLLLFFKFFFVVCLLFELDDEIVCEV